jgi:hypothetical protein
MFHESMELERKNRNIYLMKKKIRLNLLKKNGILMMYFDVNERL